MFKKLAKKVTHGVKEVVREETQKTTDEIKDDILNGVKALIPFILCVVGALAVVAALRKPIPVSIKVIVKPV